MKLSRDDKWCLFWLGTGTVNTINGLWLMTGSFMGAFLFTVGVLSLVLSLISAVRRP